MADEELKEFTGGSKQARQKLNAMVRKIKELADKKRKTTSYSFVFCEDGEAVVFLIEAIKQGPLVE
jgi:hypothetical protein